jgi:hypothetical protein
MGESLVAIHPRPGFAGKAGLPAVPFLNEYGSYKVVDVEKTAFSCGKRECWRLFSCQANGGGILVLGKQLAQRLS